MGVVAVRVAERVLHVADQRIEPVDDVKRSIRPELEGDRPEIGVGRLQERLDRRARESRAVFLDAIPQNALEADVVVQKVVALGVVGEMTAVDQLAAARRPPLHCEETLSFRRASEDRRPDRRRRCRSSWLPPEASATKFWPQRSM